MDATDGAASVLSLQQTGAIRKTCETLPRAWNFLIIRVALGRSYAVDISNNPILPLARIITTLSAISGRGHFGNRPDSIECDRVGETTVEIFSIGHKEDGK